MKAAPKPTSKRPAKATRWSPGPDLQTQLEELLNAVWAAEANWRLDDRLDLAHRSIRRPR
jgi:hypothetical protein